MSFLQRKQKLAFVLLFLMHLLDVGCRRQEKFSVLGDNVASPVAVAASRDGQHFYVLNNDFDRTYNVGSILVLDKAGNKEQAVEVPRMGSSLTVAGDRMLVTVDYQQDPGNDRYPPHVLLYDISDPTHPLLKRDWPLTCSPISATQREAYQYFAVACDNGNILVGTFADDLANSDLHYVRGFNVIYRALYLDVKRDMLLGFPTLTGKATIGDVELLDTQSYNNDANSKTYGFEIKKDSSGKLVPGGSGDSIANEVPDAMENTKRQLANSLQRQTYQFFAYDLKKESSNAPDCPVNTPSPCSFPFREMTDPVAMGEQRWSYFRLNNFDGSPDQTDNFADKNFKFYRTNFFQARPDPDNPDIFYVSQRGSPDRSPFANQIVRVTVAGDYHSTKDKDTGSYTFPTTASAFKFERVYGFRGAEATKYSYPGDFAIARINSQKTIVVNNFRDLLNWVRGDTYFSLGAQILDQPSWFSEVVGGVTPKSDIRTYYQVAVNAEGRAVSCSFYGNSVVFFDIVPGVGFKEVNLVR